MYRLDLGGPNDDLGSDSKWKYVQHGLIKTEPKTNSNLNIKNIIRKKPKSYETHKT